MIGNTHALGLATKGILAGSTIGLTSQGYLIQIEEFEYVPPIIPPTIPPSEKPPYSPGGGGIASTQKKKVIVVTVMAYGKKIVTKHVLNDDVKKIEIKDIQIIEGKNGKIDVKIEKGIRIGSPK